MLAEVAESAASGRVAEIYDDIRRVLGLPMVNLVYRHLATRPTLLEEAWAALRPNLGSEAGEAAAARVRAEAGSTAQARGTLAAETLDAYARANSLNLLGMHALLDGCPGSGLGGAAVEPPAAATILPMPDLASVPPPVLARLEELGAALVGAEVPRIVPSLLRHFAHDARLLDRFATVLRPAAAEIAIRAERVDATARALAAGLPYPVAVPAEEPARALARRFAVAMSRMLVAAETLRAAL